MGKAAFSGSTPKHAQLRERLVALATEIGPEAAIPSERELMGDYDVSRGTVRKAIEGLIVDGLLHRVHGKGTFVSSPRFETRLHLASFSQDMRRRGLTPSTRLLAVEMADPPAEIAAEFGSDRAWRMDRIRLADGVPIAIEYGWYAADLLPGLDRLDLSGSLYDLIAQQFGLVIDSAHQTLWGESAEGSVARALDAPIHTPLLVFRRSSTAQGRLIEHVISRYRGDRYQVHMSLGRADLPTNPPVPYAPTDEGNAP